MKAKVLRILVVARSTSAHSHSGGMEANYEEIVRSFIATGASVSLLTTRMPPNGSSATLPAYDQIIETHAGRPGRYSLAWWRETLFTRVPEEMKVDVVFSVSSAAFALAFSHLFRKCTAPWFVGQCHGTALAEAKSATATGNLQILRLLLNLSRVPRDVAAYKLFSKTITVSDSVAKQLRSFPYSIKSDKISTIANGINQKLFEFSDEQRLIVRSELGIAQQDNVAIYFGRVDQSKGVDSALKSMSPAVKIKHMIICGESSASYAAELAAIVKREGLVGRVHFIGRVHRASLSRYLSAADVAILPSRRTEGLSLSMLEALACGLSVICTPATRVPASLEHFSIVCDGSPAGIAKALQEWNASSIRASKITSEFSEFQMLTNYIDEVLVVQYAQS